MLLPAPAMAQAANPDDAARAIVRLTNDFRRSEKLQTLETSAELRAAALEFARFMARTGKYGHRADGRTPVERASQAGYEHCIVAENIALQRSSTPFTTKSLAEGFVQGWKDSPGHRENLLRKGVTETGVAVAAAADGGYYAVQMLGRPARLAQRFEIVNRSGAGVTYRIDGKAFELAPRTTRTHRRCTSARLELQGKTRRPKDGERIVVD